MVQVAYVKKILDNCLAVVQVERISACGKSCSSCGGGCAEKRIVSVNAKNPIGAKEGDRVIIETKSSRVLLAAALVYLFPLTLLLFAYFLCLLLFNLTESALIFVSIAAFLCGCMVSAGYNKLVRRDKALEYIIIANETGAN